MPLPKAPRSASKKRKKAVAAEAFHELKQAGYTGKQRIAIALRTSGQAKPRRKKAKR